LKVKIIKIEFDSYNFWWDILFKKYGNFLNSRQLLDFINENTKSMSESSFEYLPKDGVSLPVGIKPKGKWLFGLDAVLRWYLGINNQCKG
jgi:hypothetical protein